MIPFPPGLNWKEPAAVGDSDNGIFSTSTSFWRGWETGCQSWVAWAVLLVVAALLGFVGYHFSVRTLRIAAAGVAAALVVFVTGYGLAHPAWAPADLASSFTRGADELSAALCRVRRLGRHVPAPGRAGWLVIAVALVIGYRLLEALH